ncbi:MAG TPA: sigma-70 family RNA polymerase sigma factor [Planctomicrobium sp.]|nr:sigma-70 family RNA polymerase sigma factor [Planctomicrobium sp.]
MFPSFSDHEPTDTEHETSQEAEFLRLLATSYRDLYASALSIVGNRNDVEDVIQEVCVVLWKKYDEFEQGTNFRKWACAIAFNVAKAYARKQRRAQGAGLSEEALLRITQMRTAGTELFELRREVLRNCVGKLPEKDRRFLAECYRPSISLIEFAQRQERTVSAVYSKLKRIRKAIADCVHKQLGKGDE